MIVVGDTGPLNYLILIGEADILTSLYSRVAIPQAVANELGSAGAPEVVRKWIDQSPAWLDIQSDPPEDRTLGSLDLGERAAIGLALSIKARQILMDDSAGRLEAERRNLKVTGTLGILVEAHQRGFLDFESALGRLAGTSFYLSPRLLNRLRQLL